MNDLSLLLNRAGAAAAGFAGPAFLQSAVLIAVVALLDRLLRRRVPAAGRAALWLLVLVKLALPPSLALPTGLGYWLNRPAPPPPAAVTVAPAVFLETDEASLPRPPATPAPRPAPLAPRLSLEAWLLLGWAAGTLALAGLTLAQWLRVLRLARGARPAAPELAARLERAARRLGLRRAVRLRLADSPHGPLVFGLFRPVILLPERLAAELGPDQLDDVLLHELAHVRRGDLWTGHAQALLQCLWWWHPLVWLAGRRLDRAREEAADEAVLAALDREPPRYAETLVAVARLVTARPGLTLGFLGILERRSALRWRVERLLDGPTPRRRLSWGAALLLAVFAATALPMAPGPAEVAGATPTAQDSERQDATIQQLRQELWDQRERVASARGRLAAESLNDDEPQEPPVPSLDEQTKQLREQLRLNPPAPLGGRELIAELEAGLGKLTEAVESSARILASMPEGSPTHRHAKRDFDGAQFVVELVRLKLAEARLQAALSAGKPASPPEARWQPWSGEAVQAARAAGRIVLVNFTADWDLVSQANRRMALEAPAVRERLIALGVVTLAGDHTRFDPDIAAELECYGRIGVPLTLVFPPQPVGPAEALPESLTPALVLAALDRAAGQAVAAGAATPATPAGRVQADGREVTAEELQRLLRRQSEAKRGTNPATEGALEVQLREQVSRLWNETNTNIATLKEQLREQGRAVERARQRVEALSSAGQGLESKEFVRAKRQLENDRIMSDVLWRKLAAETFDTEVRRREAGAGPKTVLVTVAKDAPHFYLGERAVTLDQLEQELRSLAAANTSVSVAIRAEKDAASEHFFRVMDAARAAKVHTINAIGRDTVTPPAETPAKAVEPPPASTSAAGSSPTLDPGALGRLGTVTLEPPPAAVGRSVFSAVTPATNPPAAAGPPPANALVTRFYRLAAHRLVEAMRRSGVPEAAQAPTSTEAVLAYFKAAGVEATPPKALFLNEELGILMARLPMDEMEVVQTAVETLNMLPPMVQFETQFIAAAAEVARLTELLGARDFTVLTAEEARGLREKAAAPAPAGGAQALAVPRVTGVSGRQGQVQAMEARTVVRPEHPQGQREDFGLLVDVVPQVEPDGVSLTLVVTAGFREFLGYEEGEATPRPRIRSLRTGLITGVIQDGQTLLARLRPESGGAPEDAGACILVTPTLVDPAGNPVNQWGR
jgi:beta-lactamase regulating signal transducer with metallopeptidase domain